MNKHPFALAEGLLADADVRMAALNPAQSFIVQAPAGSGKTRLLITRYLTLLATVEEPEEIVAITFTRKAAAEMRQRIQAALVVAGLQTDSVPTDSDSNSNSNSDSLWRAAVAALVRDRARGWNILQSPSRFRIQTIDAFNANLARQAPLTARFGAQPQTAEQPQALYAEAARDVLAALDDRNTYSEAVATLLLHLDNDHSKLCGLIAQMLAKRDQWLRNFPGIDVATQSAQLRASLQQTLNAERRNKFIAANALFSHSALPRWTEILKLINFARGNKDLPEIAEFEGVTANDGLAWEALTEYFLTKENTIRKQVNVGIGFPPDAGCAKEKKTKFQAVLKTLEAIPNAAETLAALRTLPAAQYTDAEWQILEAAWCLLPYAIGCLWQVFARHGQCDFTEVALAADRALGTEDTPSDLALKLDVAIAHILVDEFQDTSQAQYNLLQRLTQQWGADAGRTLFLVGDPMQSIYRFREARVGLFLSAQQHGLGDVALKPCALRLNFRSHPAIIAWINATFSHLMVGGANHDAVSYLPSATPYVNDAATQYGTTLHAVAQRPEQTPRDAKAAEAAKVVACIQQAQALDAAGTIAILVRSRTHLSQILPALRSTNITYVAHDLDALSQRAVVQDCLALTRALLHDEDRTAWLACLRAPWCGLSLAELDALFGLDSEASTSIYQQLKIVETKFISATISEQSMSALLHFTQAINAARATFRNQPLRDCVEQLWLSLDGLACCREDRDITDVSTFFDCLESAETAGNLINVGELENALAGRYSAAPPAQTAIKIGSHPAVEIMTIHKAKGLEFDTVIVPGLNQKTPNKTPELLLFQELDDVSHAASAPLLLAPIAEGGVEPNKAAPQTIYRYLTQLAAAQQRQENIRLLYVVATRAAKRLHLLASIKVDMEKFDPAKSSLKPEANSLLAAFWPALGDNFSALAVQAARSAETPAVAAASPLSIAPQRLVRNTALTAAEVPSAPARPRQTWVPSSTQSREARHIGTVIHELLARIADSDVANWNATKIGALAPLITKRLAALSIIDDGASQANTAAILAVQAQVNACLSHPRGNWLLQPHRDAKSEWRLAGNVDGNIVHITIDRTFIDEAGTRWIVDYKTATPQAGEDIQKFLNTQQSQYQAQLNQYAEIVAGLKASDIPEKIMLALYFPLIDGWCEWRFLR